MTNNPLTSVMSAEEFANSVCYPSSILPEGWHKVSYAGLIDELERRDMQFRQSIEKAAYERAAKTCENWAKSCTRTDECHYIDADAIRALKTPSSEAQDD